MAIVVTRCGKQLNFAYSCQKSWYSLEPTAEGDAVKFCSECTKNVFFVNSDEDFAQAARLGRCVAIEVDDGPDDLIITMGIPAEF